MRGRVTSTSFVGREDELGRLHQGLQSAAAGEPGAVLIAGEAGVGKTRLVQEFASQVADQAEVLLGSCIQLSGGGLPYGPIVNALRPLTRDLDPAELDELLGRPGSSAVGSGGRRRRHYPAGEFGPPASIALDRDPG